MEKKMYIGTAVELGDPVSSKFERVPLKVPLFDTKPLSLSEEWVLEKYERRLVIIVTVGLCIALVVIPLVLYFTGPRFR